MIAFYSCGGLGNQLFQYATARRLAQALGVELAVDTAWHRARWQNTTPRQFELFRLRVKVRELTVREALWARGMNGLILSRLPLPRRWRLYKEKGFGFDPAVLACGDETYLKGYWQSPRYFADIRDLLIEELAPLEPLPPPDMARAEEAQQCESVAVHVRRGDYVLKTAAEFHGLCSLEYYRNAFRLVAERVRNPIAYVFSDDPDWTRENIRLDAPTIYLSHGAGAAAHQDLWLMARCRHNVIANSSFSWWGAWLGSPGDRVVVAPKTWFANGTATPDLLPSSWLVV